MQNCVRKTKYVRNEMLRNDRYAMGIEQNELRIDRNGMRNGRNAMRIERNELECEAN
jgi:hypothetical protein